MSSEPTPAAAAMERARRVLRETFGYPAFRGRQAEIIGAALEGRDALVLMPTGGGKSLCYQIPALVRDGVGIVVSPLIALMEDQVGALREAGVAAAYLNSSQRPLEQRAVLARLTAGDLKLLYLAPERLLQPETLEMLASVPVALIAIDEAHCVSQWGHDFRTEYLGLAVLKQRFPDVPRMALTATATGPTREEIVEASFIAAALRAGGIESVTGDVCDPDTLRALPGASTVLYAVGMDYRAARPMHEVYVRGLANVLDTLPPCARFIYVSSTSVYGQSAGEWVTEQSPAEPTEASGKVVMEAEQLLRARVPGAVVLRCAGQYGPNRLLRKQAIMKGEPLAGDAEKWLNLVHIADAATAVLHAETHAMPGETYNLSDGAPATRRDFYTRLAELLGTEAKFEPRAEPDPPAHRHLRRADRQGNRRRPQRLHQGVEAGPTQRGGHHRCAQHRALQRRR